MEYSQAKVNGKPTYELEEEAKNNLELCLLCCESEIKAFIKNKNFIAPAPYFFRRAAILLKNEKRWQELNDIAEIYMNAIGEYRKVAKPHATKIWLSPEVKKIQQLLEKAKLILKVISDSNTQDL